MVPPICPSRLKKSGSAQCSTILPSTIRSSPITIKLTQLAGGGNPHKRVLMGRPHGHDAVISFSATISCSIVVCGVWKAASRWGKCSRASYRPVVLLNRGPVAMIQCLHDLAHDRFVLFVVHDFSLTVYAVLRTKRAGRQGAQITIDQVSSSSSVWRASTPGHVAAQGGAIGPFPCAHGMDKFRF